jgi:hypothetical protein
LLASVTGTSPRNLTVAEYPHTEQRQQEDQL